MIAFEYSELDKSIPIKNNYYIPKELYKDEKEALELIDKKTFSKIGTTYSKGKEKRIEVIDFEEDLIDNTYYYIDIARPDLPPYKKDCPRVERIYFSSYDGMIAYFARSCLKLDFVKEFNYYTELKKSVKRRLEGKNNYLTDLSLNYAISKGTLV